MVEMTTIAMPLDSDPLNGTIVYRNSIPDRIRCHVQIQVRESPIYGAGRAVFAMQKVKMGDVIFTIPDPLVAVVSAYHLGRDWK